MKLITPIIALAILCGCSPSANKDKAADDATSKTTSRVVSFDADSAFHYIETQVAFGPRVPGTAAHTNCADYIIRSFRSFGADTVIVQDGTMIKYDGKPIGIRNIMARFNPEAPKRILIAAHYDSRPWADEEHDSSKHNMPIPGANDGASGVGVMMELARLIGQTRPEIGVDFLAVDAEDLGISGGWGDNEGTWCLGAQYWTAHLPYASATDRPVYGIVLDMVGGLDAVFYREHISERLAPEVNNKIWGTAARSEYADRFVNAVSGSLIDDHLFINRAGIPCIDIVECNNPSTGSFPPTWHTLDDDMHSIDRNTLQAVGQTVADVIYSETVY